MILCDTSVIISLIRASDHHHRRCVEATQTIFTQLVTTWPCITEAMYLLDTQQNTLQTMIKSGFLFLLPLVQEDALRIGELMEHYNDAPMDFADASLVVAAEKYNVFTILTLDRHFYAYRINGKTPFEVLPQ